MRIEILSRRQRVETEYFRLDFDCISVRGAGYSFDCTKDGTVLGDEFRTKEEREAAVAEVTAHPDYEGPFLRTYTHSYMEPAVGRCECGASVTLQDPLDNECEECHRWYNMVGQEVLDPNSALGREARAFDDRFADEEG
jgi:hypothetical protein